MVLENFIFSRNLFYYFCISILFNLKLYVVCTFYTILCTCIFKTLYGINYNNNKYGIQSVVQAKNKDCTLWFYDCHNSWRDDHIMWWWSPNVNVPSGSPDMVQAPSIHEYLEGPNIFNWITHITYISILFVNTQVKSLNNLDIASRENRLCHRKW